MVDTNRLKGHMVSKGFTQRSLALRLGCSKNTLNSKINNKISMDTEMIEKLCDVLGITDNAEKAEIFLAAPSRFRDKTA